MATDVICRAKASYKKIPGLLELTSTHLQWSQDGKGVVLKVPNVQAASLFCSKEGAAQVRLKLGVTGDEGGQGHNFTFLAPAPTATQDREAFKRELSSIISRNRTALENAATPQPGTPGPFPGQPPAFPRPLQSLSRGSTPGASPRTPLPPSSPGNPEDFRLRKTVLLKNPELAALHLELVMGGQIAENEFWEGREVIT